MLPLLLPLLWAGSLAQDEGYQLTVQESVTVQEGLCVFVPCSVTYPRSSNPYWSRFDLAHGSWLREGANEKQGAAVATNKPGRKVQEETQGRFYLLGNSQTYNCSLDIRDARRSDDGKYFFRLERGQVKSWNYKSNLIFVHVTPLTHTPHILIPGTLESGLPTNLTCSVPWACERGTPPIFSWTSAALTSLGPRTHFSSVITLTPRPQDHGTNLTCQVKFPAAGVTVETTIQLNVTCAPQNPNIGVCFGDGSGEPGTRSGVVLGAVTGAGVTALLALCLFLIYLIVKTHRKKAARTAVGVDNIHPAIGPTFLGALIEPQPGSLTDHPPPTLTVCSSGEKEEVHYAMLRFQKRQPGNPQKQQVPDNKYSEVNISN
ncbi:myeloid cell surface antigen CD33-like isoform 2-T2 [Hipposideros larvatus]